MLGLSLGLQSAYNFAVCDVSIIFQQTTGPDRILLAQKKLYGHQLKMKIKTTEI